MISLEDYLRDMPPQKQVEALKSYLLHAEQERDELREQVARLEAQLENARAANNLRQRRLDAAVGGRDSLRAALEPVAEWFRAMLDAHQKDQTGFLPDWAVIFNTNDVKLTTGQARALVVACGPACGLTEALKGAE